MGRLKSDEQGDGNNDAEVFETTFKKLHPGLMAYATPLTNDRQEAKDIVQNAFVRLWERRNELLTVPTLKNYMYATVHNMFIDLYRKKQTKNNVLEHIKANALKSYIAEIDARQDEKIEFLKKQIENLPPRCRQILIMNKRDGMKYKEIARELNISVKSVESQMRIAFKRIRENFHDEAFVLAIVFA
jgi:RNA polymerase sigma-70 factor (ECF subfamily)